VPSPAISMQTLDRRVRTHAIASLMAAVALAACGGGGDAPAPAPSAAAPAPPPASVLTFSETTPSVHNTTADPGTAATKGNDARAADPYSSVPYCDVYFEDFTAANGKRYALQVYFRQGDKLPLFIGIFEAGVPPPPWQAQRDNNGNAITAVSVDTAARTLTFTSAALTSPAGAVTISGTVGFQPNATVPACGA